jgi:hypothetical protein
VSSQTSANPILPDPAATCIALAHIRGQLEDLIASPSTPNPCLCDLLSALVLVRRAAGSNYLSWAGGDADAADPYAGEPISFELTPEGLRAAAGVD